jgi:hypothetical protein
MRVSAISPHSPNSRASYRVQRSFPQWPEFLRAPGPVDMWTTQERCPHTHRRNNSSNKLQKGIRKIRPFGVVRRCPLRRAQLTGRSRRRLSADPDSHSQVGYV